MSGNLARALPRALPRALAAALLLAGTALPAPAGADSRLTVVELYTSQGCPACPAADALLGRLAGKAGILALSFHVDYWDYMGWEDPFAAALHSQRQRHYLSKLRLPYVYTPQIVIDGKLHASGNRPHQVEAGIARARRFDMGRLEVSLTRLSDELVHVRIPRGDAPYRGEADIMLVRFDEEHVTDVTRGANRGKTLTNRNVVRLMRPVASWNGEAIAVVLRLQDMGDANPPYCAVFVQARGQGRILGASVIDMRAPRPRG